VIGKDGRKDLVYDSMRKILLCFVSFGTVLLIAFGFVMEIKVYLASNQEPIPVFQEQLSTEDNGLLVQKVESLTPVDITLPCEIEGTNLIAESVISYEGPFLEDGSNQEVVNVMALMLYNSGDAGVEQATVVLERDILRFVFEADMIPPGARVLVLEKERAFYGYKNFTSCYGWQTINDSGWTNWPVTIREISIGALEISNQTYEAYGQMQIYYKTQLEGVLVGGITFVHTIKALDPGETVQIYPEHYAKGYSKIVKVSADQERPPAEHSAGGA